MGAAYFYLALYTTEVHVCFGVLSTHTHTHTHTHIETDRHTHTHTLTLSLSLSLSLSHTHTYTHTHTHTHIQMEKKKRLTEGWKSWFVGRIKKSERDKNMQTGSQAGGR